jgi:hypothetical protein
MQVSFFWEKLCGGFLATFLPFKKRNVANDANISQKGKNVEYIGVYAQKAPEINDFWGFFTGQGGIRTLGTLLAHTRFPIGKAKN